MMGKDERARAEAAAAALLDDGAHSVVERRNFDRYEVEWAVDCVAQGDTFLYASITNISAGAIPKTAQITLTV